MKNKIKDFHENEIKSFYEELSKNEKDYIQEVYNAGYNNIHNYENMITRGFVQYFFVVLIIIGVLIWWFIIL